VNALAALAAAPIAYLVIAGLLHWPRALKAFGADPRPDRWHTSPTPAFGGIGIFAGFLVGVVAATAIGPVGIVGEMLTVLAGAGIVFAFGLLDDLVHLHPAAKLGAQLLAAFLVLQSSISVEFVANPVLAWAVGFLWLVGLTNAFNLLDNMDGLAGSLGIVAAGCFALSAAFVSPNRDIFIIAAALALALIGFIPYNLRPSGPARVFMGDSGSQAIGFVLASLGLMASYKEAGTTIATVALPVLILAVPILDTTLVTALRLRSGRSVTQGGRDHTSHRLVYRGLSEKRAVLFLVAVSAALGATSLAYAVLDSGRITAIGVLVTFALLLQFAAFLSGVSAAPGETALSARTRLLVDTLVDGALTAASLYAAYVVVVKGDGTEWQRHIFIWTLPAVLVCRYLALWGFGLYRADRADARRGTLARLAAAVAVSELAAYLFVANTQTTLDFPAKIFALDAAFCFLMLVGGRYAERTGLRLFRAHRRRRATVAAS
jgi:UDP-GlcNAc:undecaprenyl-phosphate/decaprenyl-phosphate GlcNAc-1-phosphate transferase